MTKTVNFKVGMSCNGCKNAVTKVLTKVEGVTEVNADLSTKKVAVTCADSVESAVLLDALKKWSATSGKTVELVA